jgi:hypothetical protein
MNAHCVVRDAPLDALGSPPVDVASITWYDTVVSLPYHSDRCLIRRRTLRPTGLPSTERGNT